MAWITREAFDHEQLERLAACIATIVGWQDRVWYGTFNTTAEMNATVLTATEKHRACLNREDGRVYYWDGTSAWKRAQAGSVA